MSVKSVTIRLIGVFALPMLAACGGNPPAPPAASAPAQPAAQATTPAADDALAPLYGTWALDLAQCGTQTLKISKTRFEGPDSGCNIGSFADNGDGTYTAAMTCGSGSQAADEKIQMRPIYAPTGEGIDLVYLNRDNLATTVLRCPAP